MLKAGWIVQLQNTNVRLRYAIPAPYKPKEEVTLAFIRDFLKENKPVCIPVDKQVSDICPVPVKGGFIVAFPMANRSVLIVHSPKKEPWKESELRQLEPVIRKFGVALLASSILKNKSDFSSDWSAIIKTSMITHTWFLTILNLLCATFTL